MARTQSFIRKPALKGVAAAFGLIILACMLNVIAAQECEFLRSFVWAALQLSRPAILAAKTSVSSHPCPASSVVQYLLQIVASNWPAPSLVG